MGWLRRLGGARTPGHGADEPEEPEREPLPSVERTSPGIAALLEGLHPDGRHTLLDIGPASERNLRRFGRFARRIRFADLLTGSRVGQPWAAALESVPRHPTHAYDVILAWNLLDRMGREERIPVVARLVELTKPGARLYLVTSMSDEPTAYPLRFSLLDDDRVLQEAVGAPEPSWPTLLPAEVERLLLPFRVEHAFTLRHSLREYVAVHR